MFLKEICIIATVLFGINCKSIGGTSKLEPKSENSIEVGEEHLNKIADSNLKSNTVKDLEVTEVDKKRMLIDRFEHYLMDRHGKEHVLEDRNERPEEIDNTNVSFELSLFERFRQSIFDILIILFKNDKPIKYKENRPIYHENEAITIDQRIWIDDNYNYATNISINDYMNLVLDLEEHFLKPSNISKTFQDNVNVDVKLINLGKKFLRNFVLDIKANKFPLIFYDLMFPYLRINLLPIMNRKKISEKTSKVLSFEIIRPQLFNTLRILSNKIELPNETLNLKNFLNTLDKVLNSSKFENPQNEEIKLVYVDLLAELLGIVRLELYDAAIPVKSFIAFFDALLQKSTTEGSVLKEPLTMLHRIDEEPKSFCPLDIVPLGEVIELSYCNYKTWIIDLLDRFHHYFLL